MEKQVLLSENIDDVFLNAQEKSDMLMIYRITPLLFFKGILELEDSSPYDYIMDNTMYDNGDIEMAFTEILYDIGILQDSDIMEENSKNEEAPKKDVTVLQFTNGNSFTVDVNMFKLFKKMLEISQNCDSDHIEVEHALAAIVEKIPRDILSFLRTLSVDIKEFKNNFSIKDGKYKDTFSVPNNIKPFIKVMNDDFKKGQMSIILGRDKETEEVWTVLQKRTKRNAILVGEPGVGKTSIVKKLTYDIVNGNCPEEFKQHKVLCLSINSAIAGTSYRGEAEERFEDIIKFLGKEQKVILFIDEIHTMLGAGACREGEMDLANALKPLLADDIVRVVGATTEEEYEKYFSRDGALKRRFKPIRVKEPTSKEVYPMLKNSILDLSRYHGVKISKTMVEYAILISACFNHETRNPDRTIDLIDLAMVTAKKNGKKVVDKESIIQNFDICFEKFKKMDFMTKKSTAYHEAGHYLMWRCSEKLKDIEAVALSIMPAEYYLGITVFEEINDNTSYDDYNYHIDSIAISLAGRVAEKMFTKSNSSGARKDLEMATKQAYQLVTKYGMSGKSRIYIENNESYSMINDAVVDNINKEIDVIIQKAYERADSVLKENEVYLKKIVNRVMRKGILTKKDLDEIFLQHHETKKQVRTINN